MWRAPGGYSVTPHHNLNGYGRELIVIRHVRLPLGHPRVSTTFRTWVDNPPAPTLPDPPRHNLLSHNLIQIFLFNPTTFATPPSFYGSHTPQPAVVHPLDVPPVGPSTPRPTDHLSSGLQYTQYRAVTPNFFGTNPGLRVFF